ncbi:hypothetical protein IAU60_001872 [Kwoniella sp. DSM 27419]
MTRSHSILDPHASINFGIETPVAPPPKPFQVQMFACRSNPDVSRRILDELFNVAPISVLQLSKNVYKEYINKLYRVVVLDQRHKSILWGLGPTPSARKPTVLNKTRTLVLASGWAVKALQVCLPDPGHRTWPGAGAWHFEPLFSNLKYVHLTWNYVAHFLQSAQMRNLGLVHQLVFNIVRYVRTTHPIVDYDRPSTTFKHDACDILLELVNAFKARELKMGRKKFPLTVFRVSLIDEQDVMTRSAGCPRGEPGWYYIQFVPRDPDDLTLSDETIAEAIWRHADGKFERTPAGKVIYLVSNVAGIIARLLEKVDNPNHANLPTDVLRRQLEACIQPDDHLQLIGFQGNAPDFSGDDRWEEDPTLCYEVYQHWAVPKEGEEHSDDENPAVYARRRL